MSVIRRSVVCLLPFLRGNRLRFAVPTPHSYCRFQCQALATLSVANTHVAPIGKIFTESENEYAHSILEKIGDYINTIVKPLKAKDLNPNEIRAEFENLADIPWSALSNEKACTLFRKVSIDAATVTLLPVSSDIYSTMRSELSSKFVSMSDEQLSDILLSLSLWPKATSPKDENFYSFWKSLDNVCDERSKQWDINKVLYFIDLWYGTRLTRMSSFVYHSITYLGKKPYRMSAPQIVQFLFYLNTLRTAHKGFVMYDTEHRLEECINQLSLQEIGVAMMGFFKTQTVVQSEQLLTYLMRRLINEISTAPEITISTLLKVFRRSLPIPLWPMLPELLDAVETQIDRLSLQCCMHIALVVTSSLTLHPPTLTKVSQKLVDEIRDGRLKDIERIIFPLTLLNFDPKTSPCIFEVVLEELKRPERETEFDLHPKCLVALIHYLALKSLFPKDLISRVLSMDFIRKTYGKTNYMIGREILSIDSCVSMECPDYGGPRLPENVRNYLSKRYSTFLPDPTRKLSKHGQFTLDVMKSAEQLLGKDSVTFKYILPNQSRPDIVFRLDNEGRTLPLPKDFLRIEDFTGPVKPPKGDWRCIVLGTRNIAIGNSTNLNGETTCKLRHLKILGYKPIMIFMCEWPKSDGGRIKYLKSKLFL